MPFIQQLVVGLLTGAVALVSFAPASSADDLERGEVLFDSCSQCHGTQGQGNQAALAPAIAGLPQWYAIAQLGNFRDGLRGLHPDDVGGMRMRPMSLTLKSDEDVVAVAAYVASLPATDPEPIVEGGDATKGAVLYAPCIACHAPDGTGNEQLQGAPLAGASDWYLLEQLRKFKSGARGTRQGDQYGALMAAMAATLADEQAMRDVLAHIQTLQQ